MDEHRSVLSHKPTRVLDDALITEIFSLQYKGAHLSCDVWFAYKVFDIYTGH